MEWTSYDTWIVTIGALCAASCALPGTYLVLRRMSMMGDAISHTVLPGLVAAFLVTNSRGLAAMLGGAVVVGIVTAMLVQLVKSSGKIDEGAAMGVVFTSLFAAGLIMIRQAADHVDLDPSCVLFGSIELAPFSSPVALFGWELPRAAAANLLMLLVNAGFILLFYKELKLSSFDPALATSLGINAGAMHYLLMVLVATTTVAAFESVGSILVIAMLIVPGAAAHLLTDRLSHMLLISVAIAAASAVIGHVAAITVPTWFGFRDTSTAGMMATVSGSIFLLAFLFAPRHGLISRVASRVVLGARIAREDILATLYRRDEQAEGPAPVAEGDLRTQAGRGIVGGLAMRGLRRDGSLAFKGGECSLTSEGRTRARDLIRSHRLWESFLVDEAGLRPDHVHQTAERLEHVTDPEMCRRLLQETGAPESDPHARQIPSGD